MPDPNDQPMFNMVTFYISFCTIFLRLVCYNGIVSLFSEISEEEKIDENMF